jgi:hypothetical protein
VWCAIARVDLICVYVDGQRGGDRERGSAIGAALHDRHDRPDRGDGGEGCDGTNGRGADASTRLVMVTLVPLGPRGLGLWTVDFGLWTLKPGRAFELRAGVGLQTGLRITSTVEYEYRGTHTVEYIPYEYSMD